MTRRTTVTLGLVGALLLAACGTSASGESEGVASLSEEDTGTTVLPDNGPADAEEAYMAFTDCMRAEGIDMPDPEVDADGNIQGIRIGDQSGTADVEAIRAAGDKCGHLLEGVTQSFDRADPSEIEDTLLEFAACMRDHGIDFPDPDISGGGVMFGSGPGHLELDDPAVSDAMDECSQILDEAWRGPQRTYGQLNMRAEVDEPRRFMPRRVLWLIAAGLVVVVGLLVWAGARATSAQTEASEDDTLATAEVVRTDLQQTTTYDGALGKVKGDPVTTPVPGTVTTATPAGSSVAEGDILYGIDGTPTVLLQGETPPIDLLLPVRAPPGGISSERLQPRRP